MTASERPDLASDAPSYLDHAATTALLPQAQAAWVDAVEQLRRNPGNPSSLHAGGRAARRMLEDARERVAVALGAEKNEVVFTSGATESDLIGVLGAARGARAADPARNRICVSGIEHDAVAQQRDLAVTEGFDWELFPVNFQGVSDPTVSDPATVGVASMTLVCAETGVIQPVERMVKQLGGKAYSHTDAAQAVGQIPVNFAQLGVDLLSIGGHKLGAPVGTGALLARRGVKIVSDRPGGGHERKIRSGTVDVAGAVALAVAVETATAEVDNRAAHSLLLRRYLVDRLPPEVTVTSEAPSAPGLIHLSLPTRHPEALLLVMDQHGVMVSAGSACHAGVTRPSVILERMGRSESEALGVLRLSLGLSNTKRDLDRFLAALPAALEGAQKLDRYEAGSKR